MTPTTNNYSTMSVQVERVLRDLLGANAAIKTEPGAYGHVFVKVVSPVFDGKSEAEKQELIWREFEQKLGAEAKSVGLVLALGIDEV